MPHAAAGLHPLDPAGGQHARRAVRVFIMYAALGEVSERRDARMRVQGDAFGGDAVVIEEIEEDEWLQKLPEIGWTHQSGDGSVAMAACAPDDLTYRASRD